MQLYQVILPIMIGALIGYCTNFIAIKMLFLPRQAFYIGKWKVPMTPGVIPKNKPRIAAAVGNAVSNKLLTRQDILSGIKNSGIKENIVSSIKASIANNDSTLDDISNLIGDKILDGIKSIDMTSVISELLQSSFGSLLSNPMVSMFLGGASLDSISEQISLSINRYIDANGKEKVMPMVRQEIDSILEQPVSPTIGKIVDDFIDNNAANLISSISVKDIVEAKINDMDTKELEDLVMSVMKNELQTVINLGALIGAIIGAVNIFI